MQITTGVNHSQLGSRVAKSPQASPKQESEPTDSFTSSKGWRELTVRDARWGLAATAFVPAVGGLVGSLILASEMKNENLAFAGVVGATSNLIGTSMLMTGLLRGNSTVVGVGLGLIGAGGVGAAIMASTL